MTLTRLIPALAVALAVSGPASAQGAAVEPQAASADFEGIVEQISTHVGQMSMTMPAETGPGVTEVLRFEPWQMLDDLFRDDIVLLMRHGPTDWTFRDRTNVAPTDCENQRIMTEEGMRQMRELGSLLITNELIPGRIVVSEWCRNQQTLDALQEGMALVAPETAEEIPVETDPALNLLLSLQGAPNVTELRQIVSNWDGGDGNGPLLVLTHFTNIQELTEFSVYEGEMLVVDPKRDNRVLGYLRLASARPDIGHFDPSVVAEE